MGDLEPPTLSWVLRDLDLALLLPAGGPPVLVAGRRCRIPDEGEWFRCGSGVETVTPLLVCCRHRSGGSVVAGLVLRVPSAGLLLAPFPRLLVPYSLLPPGSPGGAKTAIIIAVVEAEVTGIVSAVVVVAAADPVKAMLLLGCSVRSVFSPSLPLLQSFLVLL